jgi:hypothetical protein
MSGAKGEVVSFSTASNISQSLIFSMSTGVVRSAVRWHTLAPVRLTGESNLAAKGCGIYIQPFTDGSAIRLAEKVLASPHSERLYQP